MRDIRGDLAELEATLKQWIVAEHAAFETQRFRLKAECGDKVEALKAELRVVNKLIDLAHWQRDMRAALKLAAAVAEAAESCAKRALETRPQS